MHSDTSTSSWMQNGGPKTFPLDHTPSKVTYGVPKGHWVADWFFSPTLYDSINNGDIGGSLKSNGVTVVVVFVSGQRTARALTETDGERRLGKVDQGT